MRGTAMVEDGGVEPSEGENGCGRDKTVDQDRDPIMPRSKGCPGYGSKFAPAQSRGHCQGVVGARAMAMHCRLDCRALALQARLIDASPATDPPRGIATEKSSAQSGCYRRVPDAHFPDREEVAVRRYCPAPTIDGGKELPSRHRGSRGKVIGGPVELDWDDPQFCTSHASELVYRSPARGEIGHQLLGDRLRIGGYTTRSNAVIAGEYEDGYALKRRHLPALPVRYPGHQLFESSKTSWRLGELGLSLNDRRRRSRITRREGPTESTDLVHTAELHVPRSPNHQQPLQLHGL
jgi:hypothetical protein